MWLAANTTGNRLTIDGSEIEVGGKALRERPGRVMRGTYEFVGRDRRYQVDSQGVAELGPDRVIERFIPWCAVKQIDFARVPRGRQVRWSVRATDGSQITPKLEYLQAIECYDVAFRIWRERMPHACRGQFARLYEKFRRRHALAHLTWFVPSVVLAGAVARCNWRGVAVPWEPIAPLGVWLALICVLCFVNNLLFLKELRQGFEPWYAALEARWTSPDGGRSEPSNAILGWLFPAATLEPGETPVSDQEFADYRWRRNLSLALILPIFVLLVAAWSGALIWGAGLIHHNTAETRFLVRPPTFYWIFPGLILGLLTTAIPLDRCYRLVFGDRYRRFRSVCYECDGFDTKHASWCLAAAAVMASIAFVWAGTTSFTRLTSDGIEIQAPFELRPRFFSYRCVRSIERRATFQAPLGNTIRSLHYVITFDDGSWWSSRENIRIPSAEVDGQIARFVSEQSKRPIIEQP